eukprot:4648682-Ditylum_brightwellii.AAC.1
MSEWQSQGVPPPLLGHSSSSLEDDTPPSDEVTPTEPSQGRKNIQALKAKLQPPPKKKNNININKVQLQQLFPSDAAHKKDKKHKTQHHYKIKKPHMHKIYSISLLLSG